MVQKNNIGPYLSGPRPVCIDTSQFSLILAALEIYSLSLSPPPPRSLYLSIYLSIYLAPVYLGSLIRVVFLTLNLGVDDCTALCCGRRNGDATSTQLF